MAIIQSYSKSSDLDLLYLILIVRMKLGEKLGEKLAEIVRIEKLKYQNKGLLNSVIGFCLLFLVLQTAEKFCRFVWPAHVENSTPSFMQNNGL